MGKINFIKEKADFFYEGKGDVSFHENRIILDDTKARSGLTLWYKPQFSRPLTVEYDAQVIDPPGAGNLNFFFCGRYGDGTSVERRRSSGDYGDYHNQYSLYILTHTGVHPNNPRLTGWSRIRKDPGFQMLSEDLSLKTEHGRIYRFRLEMGKSSLTVFRDDQLIHKVEDDNPLIQGSLGFRTWQSKALFSRFSIEKCGAE